MDRALIRRMAAELGVSSRTLDPLRGLPYEQTVEGLERLKAQAKRNFGKLAVKYHPDHNLDRVEWAAKMFNALMMAKQAIEALRARRRPVRRPMPFMQVPSQAVGGSAGPTQRVTYYAATTGPFGATTTSTAGTAYDARRVVFIHVG